MFYFSFFFDSLYVNGNDLRPMPVLGSSRAPTAVSRRTLQEARLVTFSFICNTWKCIPNHFIAQSKIKWCFSSLLFACFLLLKGVHSSARTGF